MLLQITSKENPLIKYAVKLSKRAFRYEEKRFLFEGEKLLTEALQCEIKIREAFFTKDTAEKYKKNAEFLANKGAKLYIISEELMKKISDTETPQGIICIAEFFETQSVDSLKQGKFIALVGLQDTGNVGAVIRCADAFSLDGVIIDKTSADIFSPKTIRGSMGSIFRTKIVFADNLLDEIKSLKNNGFKINAAVLDKKSKPVNEIKWTGSDIVIIGNESAGISEELIKNCQTVYIPMKGRAESLNASVAAGIIAWEMTK